MALDREMFVLRTMVHDLECLDYAVEVRVVDTWRYGVPQFRRRLVLVAIRDGVAFRWPKGIRASYCMECYRGFAQSRRGMAANRRSERMGRTMIDR